MAYIPTCIYTGPLLLYVHVLYKELATTSQSHTNKTQDLRHGVECTYEKEILISQILLLVPIKLF
jgi:hypothetical protein